LAFVSRSSRIAAPAERVWERVTSAEGINDELRPILRMTVPAGLTGLSAGDVPVGEVLGRSWILLFGVLPIDYDDICLVELEPGRRFLERSSLLSMKAWEHERVVEAAGDGACEITDRVSFQVRPWLVAIGGERIAEAVLTRLFAHRHRRLAARFAEDPSGI
jgi:ligand-binding SRPBCC domain-containing protein